MEKRVIDCEIITPMFSSGSMSTEAEFRVSELKALMRYTYRIASNIVQTKHLYQTENQLFGDAEHHASPIRIQVVEKNLPKRREPLLLHKPARPVECLLDGGAFEIVLRKFLDKGENLDFYQNLLILSLILGGLGKRSRRGRGCIAFAHAYEHALYLTRETLLPWVTEQLNVLNGQLANSENATYMLNDGEISIHPKLKTIWDQHKRPVIERVCLGKPVSNVRSYLKKVDQASHDIKKYYKPVNRNFFATGYIGGGRFASSLLISVTRTSNGQLIPVYTFVKAIIDPKKQEQVLDINYEERNKMISLIEKGRI
ncbi:hypothetical protein N0M98_02545 [Paenibacillus doosanensis]|uniref:RAMP superfamily CRISPR-associated protein n=1 Tax=Paenibacillus doosanensis TaxID=1229154 RepID=UPI0021802BDF|nr:RAMP superfamily CRISPR-associated protein [Paenibacillus doosanensis]MCS7459010.1 hypothetical protein [Paenibacillus doosanensis]